MHDTTALSHAVAWQDEDPAKHYGGRGRNLTVRTSDHRSFTGRCVFHPYGAESWVEVTEVRPSRIIGGEVAETKSVVHHVQQMHVVSVTLHQPAAQLGMI